MPPINSLLPALRAQNAPASHLQRIANLVAFAEQEPALLAMFLVGSYAKGNGDRVSDLDIAAIAASGYESAVLDAVHEVLGREDVLNQFTGKHETGGSFWKRVYLDFSSVEFHVFEPSAKFRLRRPYLSIWDPGNLATAYVVEGEPVRHADFAAYEYGDEGLIWELVDCIKWLSRGQNELAKSHLMKIIAEMKKTGSAASENSAA